MKPGMLQVVEEQGLVQVQSLLLEFMAGPAEHLADSLGGLV